MRRYFLKFNNERNVIMKRNVTNKMLLVVLALCMLLSLSVFASGEPSGEPSEEPPAE